MCEADVWKLSTFSLKKIILGVCFFIFQFIQFFITHHIAIIIKFFFFLFLLNNQTTIVFKIYYTYFINDPLNKIKITTIRKTFEWNGEEKEGIKIITFENTSLLRRIYFSGEFGKLTPEKKLNLLQTFWKNVKLGLLMKISAYYGFKYAGKLPNNFCYKFSDKKKL